MIEFRKYINGDENSILKLYQKVFNIELSIESWNWKYNGLDSNSKIIFLAFDKDKCIGHYALIPYELNGMGESIDALVSLDSMVDPDYQGRQVFSRLVDFAFKNIGNMNKPYLTFLNENSVKVYTKKFNWKYLGNVPIYIRPLSLNRFKNKYNILYKILKPISWLINSSIKKDKDIVFKSINTFSNDLDGLFKQEDYFSTSRNKFFLEWRYNSSSSEYEKYNILYMGEIIGICILRDESKFGINFIWIMDLVLKNNNLDQYQAVLNALAYRFSKKADFIVSLLPGRKYAKCYLFARYFKLPSYFLPHKFYFCVNKNMYKKDKINNLENWYMTWSLNDVL